MIILEFNAGGSLTMQLSLPISGVQGVTGLSVKGCTFKGGKLLATVAKPLDFLFLAIE